MIPSSVSLSIQIYTHIQIRILFAVFILGGSIGYTFAFEGEVYGERHRHTPENDPQYGIFAKIRSKGSNIKMSEKALALSVLFRQMTSLKHYAYSLYPLASPIRTNDIA